MTTTIRRILGVIYIRLTCECPACAGNGTMGPTLFDTIEGMLAAPLPPACSACGGTGRVWKWRGWL